MYDLFLALCTMDIPRGHPACMAMLYSFCPAAAGWWAGGLVMKTEYLPYNAAWQVLTDYASGADLSAQLERYGLDEKTIAPIKKYIDAIADIRSHETYERAPELHHSEIIKMDAGLRFGIQNVFTEHFGGDWRNAFKYARLWVYVLMDWARDICGKGKKEFTLERKDILFQLPKTNIPIKFPAFVWKTYSGSSPQPNIGFIADGANHNQFCSVMAMMSAPDRDHRWEMEPFVFALDPLTGTAKQFEPIEETDQLLQDFVELGRAVRDGPFPPLAAYTDPTKCQVCVFKFQCYGTKRELSEHARRMIVPQKALLRPMQ